MRKGLSFRKKEKKLNKSFVVSLIEWTIEIAVVLILAFVLVYFLGQRMTNAGEGMVPIMESGDTVLVNRFILNARTPKRGELIIFKPNGNQNSHSYIRRIVALPGETIQIKGGYIYIDDELLEEEYNNEKIEFAGIAEEPVVLGEDSYFVLGDNRSSSEDSRYADIGLVDRSYMEGKPWFILSPKERRGFIR